jgi:hypothetical protein
MCEQPDITMFQKIEHMSAPSERRTRLSFSLMNLKRLGTLIAFQCRTFHQFEDLEKRPSTLTALKLPSRL